MIPTFNRAEFLAEAITSIVNQLDDRDEIIIVDDGSTDDTARVLREFASVARVERQANSGKSAALNRALEVASREFVWICDDDDVLRSGAVDLLRSAMQQSAVGFVFGRYTRFRDFEGDRQELGTGYWPDLGEGTLLRHVLEDAFIMQNAMLVRRFCLDEVGPFDEAMLRSLDYEMIVRIALRFPGRYVDSIIFDQRKHDGARGPARALHAAADSASVWIDFDRRIFRRLRDRDSPLLYERMFEGDDPDLVRRAGLLQRACIFARHDMWDTALDNLEGAALLPRRLVPVERAICRRILIGKHGFAGALAPAIVERLRVLARKDSPGSQIVAAMIDGGLWQLRSSQVDERRAIRRLLQALLGPRLLGRVVRMRLARDSTASAALRERREYPHPA